MRFFSPFSQPARALLWVIPGLALHIGDALAVSCSEVFPDGASSFSDAGRITFQWDAKIINSPDGVLATHRIDDHSSPGTSCTTDACTSSNSTSAEGTPYNDFPNGRRVALGYRETTALSPGVYGTVDLGTEAVLTLQSGTYVISGNLSAGYLARIEFEPGAVTTIYVERYIQINEAKVNVPDDAQVLFYALGNVDLNYAAEVNAAIISYGNLTLQNSAVLTGAVSAAGNITLNSGSTIIFEDDVNNTSYGDFCEGASSAPSVSNIVMDVGSGTASTCQAFAVTFDIVDSSGDTVTGYVGTLDLTTSTAHGDWAKTGVASDAYGTLTMGSANQGAASYQFAADESDQGRVTLLLSNTRKETLTIGAEADGVSADSAAVSFTDNLFQVELTDSLGADQIAGRAHQYRLVMIKEDPTDGSCGAAQNYNVDDVKVWYQPSALDPGGSAPTLSSATGSANLTLPSAQPSSANFTADFTNGIAEVSLLTNDVSEFQLFVQDDSSSFADQSITGGSETIIVRPFAIDVQVSANPAASSAAGPVFIAAGDDFTVTARAVVWQAADDSNDDGIADGHNDNQADNNADLSDNPATPSFGREAISESLRLSSTLLAPAAGYNAPLTSTLTPPADATQISAFSSGVGSSSALMYPEVGIIELLANLDDSYYLSSSLASSAKIVGRSGFVGRFIPKYFSPILPASPLTPFCNSLLEFSYLGQSFAVVFSAEANNANGSTTVNYRDDFARLTLDSQLTFGALDGNTDLSARTSVGSSVFSAANGQITVASPLTVQRAGQPDGPFVNAQIGVDVVDADGVTWQASALNLDPDRDTTMDYVELGETSLRYGRLVLGDSYGPEIHDLPVTMLVQYWDGTDWRLNADDSCSELLLSDIVFPDGPANVTANRTVTVGSGSTTAQYGDLSALSVGFVDGDAGHFFSPPGAGNVGSFGVDVNLTLYPWLRFDWNQDGSYDDTELPTAEFHFGIYRGHDKVIFWREVLR